MCGRKEDMQAYCFKYDVYECTCEGNLCNKYSAISTGLYNCNSNKHV